MNRLFAIIPAAGLSRRMGTPKLLLNVEGETVLSRLLNALDHPGIAARIVVVRSEDQDLKEEAVRCQARVVCPEVAPPDMKKSVIYGLREIESGFQPGENDGWMLIPADHPVLNWKVVDLVVQEWLKSPQGILVPVFKSKRGHPTIFSWNFCQLLDTIPVDRGIDFLLENSASQVREFSCDDESILFDLDTLDDYERLKKFNQLADPRSF